MPQSVAAIALVMLPVAGLTQDIANVALGKSFVCSDPGGIAWRGLLDGDTTSDEPPGCFATGNGTDYPKRVVIDLGAVYTIRKVVVHSSGNGNTRKVDVWASRDGENYVQLRKPYAFPQGDASKMSAEFPELEARFVKVAMWDTYGGGPGGDNVLYLREVQVLGDAAPVDEATRARPKLDGPPPRSVRMFARYALREGASLRILLLADDAWAGADVAGGLGAALAERLGDDFGVGSVDVTGECKRGHRARDASTYSIPSGDDSPDLVLVGLGTADALAFDPAGFRRAMERALGRLATRSDGLIVVLLPPAIPHSEELARSAECENASTADPAWQLASLCEGTDIAIIDVAEVIERSGLDVTAAYEDNLALSQAGHRVVARAIAAMLR